MKNGETANFLDVIKRFGGYPWAALGWLALIDYEDAVQGTLCESNLQLETYRVIHYSEGKRPEVQEE